MGDKAPVRTLGLCGNPGRDELAAAMQRIIAVCDRRKVGCRIQDDLARGIGRDDLARDDDALLAEADLMVALGGDGTMLRAARLIGDTGTPLLGINLGSLGYLTDIPSTELDTALGRVLDGEYHLEGRSRVHCTIWRDGAQIGETAGLNDVCVNMGPLPRTLDLELRLAGTSLGRYLGDGIIFATATGSTAYNLSAGGAICAPGLPGMLVTPICPHSLGVRPIILAGDTGIELVLHEVGAGATLTADGQVATPLNAGDRLRCHLTEPVVQLVKFRDSDFFQVLRRKLRWGVAPRLRPASPRYHPDCDGDADPDGNP